MSKCEGGRIERLTKWSEGQKEQRLGSLDKQEHSRMVKMNLMKLEVRDELAALRKSRRTPSLVPTSPTQETASPSVPRQQGKTHGSSKNRGRIQEAEFPNQGKKHPHGVKQLDGYLTPNVRGESQSPGQSINVEKGACVVKAGDKEKKSLGDTQSPKPPNADEPPGHEDGTHNGYENDVSCSENDINDIQHHSISILSSKDSRPMFEPTSKFVRKVGRVELDKETVMRLVGKGGQDGVP